MQKVDKPDWLPSFNNEIDEHFHLNFTYDENDPNFPIHLTEENPGVSRDTGYNILAYIESITGMRQQDIGKLVKSNKPTGKFDVCISANTIKELDDIYGSGFGEH